jgi:hypothetical protein
MINMNLRRKKGMVPIDNPDRSLYWWIVIGMSLGLPAGIGIGIAWNQIPLGILAGNVAGIILGVVISRIYPYKNN